MRKIDKVALNIKARNPILVNSKGIVIGALFFSILTILFTNNFGIDLHLNYLWDKRQTTKGPKRNCRNEGIFYLPHPPY